MISPILPGHQFRTDAVEVQPAWALWLECTGVRRKRTAWSTATFTYAARRHPARRRDLVTSWVYLYIPSWSQSFCCEDNYTNTTGVGPPTITVAKCSQSAGALRAPARSLCPAGCAKHTREGPILRVSFATGLPLMRSDQLPGAGKTRIGQNGTKHHSFPSHLNTDVNLPGDPHR